MAFELTFEQIQNCKKSFDDNKKIKSDNIDEKEEDINKLPFDKICKALNDLDFKVEIVELELLLEDLNLEIKDGDSIDFPTFLRIAGSKYKQREFIQTLEDAYKSFDKDSSNSLSYNQLITILTQYGEKISKEEAEDLLKGFIDKGEYFNYKDFVNKNF